MSSVMQSDLFSAASIIIFVVGVVMFIISFIGCFGAYRGIRWMLFTVSNSKFATFDCLLVNIINLLHVFYTCSILE